MMTFEAKKIKMVETTPGQYLEVHISGKLEREDYGAFAPAVERLIEEQGKIRMLVLLEDFRGWDAGALWEDIKFEVKHFNDIERLAIVGENRWEQGMAVFCKPFTTAEVKYFPHEQATEARLWLESD
jgi:hypothetical protein